MCGMSRGSRDLAAKKNLKQIEKVELEKFGSELARNPNSDFLPKITTRKNAI